MKTINIDDGLYNRIKLFCKKHNLVLNKRIETVLDIWITIMEEEAKTGDTYATKRIKKEYKDGKI